MNNVSGRDEAEAGGKKSNLLHKKWRDAARNRRGDPLAASTWRSGTGRDFSCPAGARLHRQCKPFLLFRYWLWRPKGSKKVVQLYTESSGENAMFLACHSSDACLVVAWQLSPTSSVGDQDRTNIFVRELRYQPQALDIL